MNVFVPVAKSTDLSEGRAKSFEIDGKAIVLCKKGAEVFAFEGLCSHAFKPLEGARVRGETLMCPHHGARFDLKTGNVAASPAVRGLKTYRTRQSGDMIEVKIEE